MQETPIDIFDEPDIINNDAMPPRKAAPHRFIPATLEKICLKAMEKEPRDRFGSIDEMIEEINQFQNQALMRGSV